MIAVFKTMDVPRHILKTMFADASFPLIQHHVDSFNDMLDTNIPTFVRVSNPFELQLRDNRMIRVSIRDIRYESPKEEDGSAVVPHTCRLDNRTYDVSMFGTMDFEYKFADGSATTKTFENVLIGRMPLMLRSKQCYLSAVDGYEIGECKYELGGYFVIDGAEKVLLTQELLGDNMFYAAERKRKAPRKTLKTMIEKEDPLKVDMEADESKYEETTEYYSAIRTLSEDGTRGPFYHFLVLPSETIQSEIDVTAMQGNLGRDNRLATIQLPGFQQAVPVISVFRALGVSSDMDIYNTILAGVPDRERLMYDDIFQQIILTHDKFLEAVEQTDLEVLASQTRSKSRFEVVQSLNDSLFSHSEGGFRHKSYLLGHMMKMAMDIALGRREGSDRDNMQFKRMKTSGVLMFEEFKRIYRDIGKAMLLQMDSRLQYEAANYRDKNLVNLVDEMNIGSYWKGYRMLNEYLKSFKGQWAGRAGIAQELARPSYLAVIHHLRKTDLQIDKTASTAPPRRLYASQFGIMCPVDSPDGSDIGYKKALTILAQVSTAFPSETIKSILRKSKLLRETEDIHPSTWKPEWTRIFLNSDLIGVCLGNTEDLHALLMKARRAGEIGRAVSLAWMRVNNEYHIYSDAGRPNRPVYREGVVPDAIRATKTWKDILGYMDYIDASEADALRISMQPFHPKLPSEIHMSFCMSAAANLVPYPDHNPGPRNAFSIAQQKQAASWYHTNYMKRFDTIAMMAVLPQKPISQTWLYHEMMGCMAYGENALVAVTMYGGHNQEDSVILNGGSLKRGMYKTMYYHSYDHAEEMVEPGAQIHTEFFNLLEDETIKRKEGKNYSMLDGDGIIRVNSKIDENTILLGIRAPILTPTGQVTGYKDVSITPKRGQHGRIDAVYPYATKEGLRGVKIRILEERTPIVGDKMASRHSQKGTVGMILPEEDMPFTSTGLRPDLLFNPHGIPTRMTVGQFLEMASNKLGIHLGSFIDATPFTMSNRMGVLRKALIEKGFHPYGHDTLYNGQTGEMMESEIFMGPIYYQRLKHMVEDKINYRNTGPKKLLTHQPTQGRGDEGGLRIGEMERDALVSHGLSKFLTESLMERSDKTTVQFDKENGRFDTSRDTMDVPYAMELFTHELEAMHVIPRMIVE